MKELVEFLAKSIVDNKDDVKVTVNESANEINIDLYVNPDDIGRVCLLYTSPSPRDRQKSRMPSSA